MKDIAENEPVVESQREGESQKASVTNEGGTEEVGVGKRDGFLGRFV